MPTEKNSAGFEERFRRHAGLEEFSPRTQRELQARRVFIAGAGGLGSLVAAELTAAGVGHLTVCDDGTVEESNLNRQLFYRETDIDRTKAQVLTERLSEFAPKSVFRSIQLRLDGENAAGLIDGCDLVLDCLDNDSSRLELNRAAAQAGLPLVHGGIRGWNGEAALLNRPGAPCFACLRPHGSSPPTETQPAVATSAGIIAVLQANIALRFLIGAGDDAGRLFLWRGREMRLEAVSVAPKRECVVCGT